MKKLEEKKEERVKITNKVKIIAVLLGIGTSVLFYIVFGVVTAIISNSFLYSS